MNRSAQQGASRPTLVSIGLPVYNGAAYLRRAVDSLLSQSLADFELIISDNASIDETANICADYVRRDARVRYFRQQSNIGVSGNWNFVAQQAQGHFFKWASANDICEPTMLEKCVSALLSDRRAVVCYGRTRLINEQDEQIEVYAGDFEVTDERASDRFSRLCLQLAMNNAQSGVIRMDALRKTGLVRAYPGGDLVLMAELALLGRYVLLPDVLLNRRISQGSFSRLLTRNQLKYFWDPAGRLENNLDRMLLHRDRIVSVLRLATPMTDKLRGLGSSLRYAYWDRAAISHELREWLLSSLPRQEAQ